MGDDLLCVPESSLQQPTTHKRQKLTSTVSFDNLVSHWDLNNLEILGLFYAKQPVDINTLLDKSLSYNSQISHLSPRLKTFITILERFLNFDVSLPDDYSEGEQREDRRARWTNEMEALASLFDSIMAYVREFYNDLKQFMVDSKLNRCTEGSYRELSRAFLKACGLGIRAGNAMNQTFEIGELTVKSVPDLRCCFHSNSSEVNYQVETVLVIGEIVFTALEISEQHLTEIENVKTYKGRMENENRTGNSTMSYTRPYDYLKVSERSLIYESLLRFACYQKGLT